MGDWTTKHVVTVAISLVAALLILGAIIGAGTFTAHENNIKNKFLWEKCLEHNPVADCKVSIDGGHHGG